MTKNCLAQVSYSSSSNLKIVDDNLNQSIHNGNTQNKNLENMSLKEQFDAAVNVIKNLPKNGSYQPSNDLKLKFYSYFKQATVGPNTSPKPSFYEIVEKYKWEAWKKLVDMSKDEAMTNYVKELKTIIETMPYNESISDFYEKLGPFFEFVKDQNDITTNQNQTSFISKNKIKTNLDGISSESDDFSYTLDEVNIPNRKNKNNLKEEKLKKNEETNFVDCVNIDSKQNKQIMNVQGYIKNNSDHKTNFYEFHDCTDKNFNLNSNDIICARGEMSIFPSKNNFSNNQEFGYQRPLKQTKIESVNLNFENNTIQTSTIGEEQHFDIDNSDLNEIHEHLTLTVLRLQQKIKNMSKRIELLEVKLNEKELVKKVPSKKYLWLKVSTQTTVLFILWPFVAHLLINAIKNRKK